MEILFFIAIVFLALFALLSLLYFVGYIVSLEQPKNGEESRPAKTVPYRVIRM